MRFHVEYDSNNSGGDWWLKDKDWQKLEEAGWFVHWVKVERPANYLENGRWLGALATNACILVDAFNEDQAEQFAKSLWEAALPNQYADDEGCPCCGQPHSFYAYKLDKRIDCREHGLAKEEVAPEPTKG